MLASDYVCIPGSVSSLWHLGAMVALSDVTIIRPQDWPSIWPLSDMLTYLQGIGYANNPKQMTQLLTWKDEEDNAGQLKPYVMPNLLLALWGIDLLSQKYLVMCSPNEVVAKPMLEQGFLPGQGLVKEGQDINKFESPKPHSNTRGLGNFT